MTPWLLATIAVILFYKLVERRHKIILGKALAALVTMCAIVVGVIYIREQINEAADERDRKAVRVSLLPLPPPDTLDKDYFAKFFVKELRMEICNYAHSELRSLEFQLSGRSAGHSTEYKVAVDTTSAGSYRDYTSFTSDRIVQAGQCDTLTYSGEFNRHDSFRVRSVAPVLAGRPN